MPRILYLSPYFPPDRRVGAQRPLKFLRHLSPLGWTATVLCDLKPGDAVDESLVASIPRSTRVVRDYGAHIGAERRAALSRQHGASGAKAAFPRLRTFENPELFPLGEHALDLPHAYRAAARILRTEAIDVILVNADPFAAAVLGAFLARRTGIPLVLDFRDPWALCELRHPMRPAPTRAIVERLERWTVETARAVILNTEGARAEYERRYSDLDASKFHFIRNHADPALSGGGVHPGFDRFTLLNLGGFRRFTEGDTLLALLAELKDRGHAGSVQLVVTGSCPETLRRMAAGLGVSELLVEHPFVPPTEVGGILRAADLLVALNSNTAQRLPAKLFEYAMAGRPILAVCHNPELHRVCTEMGGARAYPRTDVCGMADYVEHEMRRGRRRRVLRDITPWTSSAAAEKLASILEQVTGTRSVRRTAA